MGTAIFNYYDQIMGTSFDRTHAVRLDLLDLPMMDLSALDCCFSEQEIKAIIDEIPSDKAPGLDGFTGRFYKCAWQIIRVDIINAFNAFWSLDSRSFHLVNEALMVLLQKKSEPQEIKDYRPISLIHNFGKLVAKCLANRLARVLDDLVKRNQSAFIKGRSIHDNFMSVQLVCKLLHSKKKTAALVKRGLSCWRCCSMLASAGGGLTGSLSLCPQPAR